ncbi:hydroxyproline-rich glycoprotein family protein [Prunus dulcis]|uniref:Hydroxyproline-rich glycoprotein family protein n=1 Tax=Prunus dulcis TaxID=3755 RepID=A0A4Y1R7M9_PRUDU|nr:hydroxyproline-rich glycoprotein family protein [Prunus dulcis]
MILNFSTAEVYENARTAHRLKCVLNFVLAMELVPGWSEMQVAVGGCGWSAVVAAGRKWVDRL